MYPTMADYTQSWNRRDRRRDRPVAPSNGKTEDQYGFFGSKGSEVQVVDWTMIVYLGIMLVLSLTNVGLLAWIGSSISHSNDKLGHLDKLTLLNDNIQLVKSTNAEIVEAIHVTNGHLLVNNLQNSKHGRAEVVNMYVNAYYDKYAGDSEKNLGSGNKNNNIKSVNSPTLPDGVSTCRASGRDANSAITYDPLDCHKKAINTCLPETAPPSSGSYTPRTAEMGATGYDNSCMGNGGSLDARNAFSSNLEDGNHYGAYTVGHAVESASGAILYLHAIQEDDIHHSWKSELENYFSVENALQTKYQNTFSACCLTTQTSSCEADLTSYGNSQKAFAKAYGKLASSAKKIKDDLISKTTSLLASDTITQEQSDQSNANIDGFEEFDKFMNWYKNDDTHTHGHHSVIAELNDAAFSHKSDTWCQLVGSDVIASHPFVSTQQCTTTESAPVYNTNNGPQKVNLNNKCPAATD